MLCDLADDLLDYLPLEDVKALFAHYAGRTLRIPLTARPDSAFVRDLGDERARRIAKALGGDCFCFPMYMEREDCISRNEEIQRKRDAGQAIASLAREYGRTERQIYHILAQNRKRQACSAP